MAKNKTQLDMTPVEVTPTAQPEATAKTKKKNAKNPGEKKRKIAVFFNGIISELKKVRWAKFKSTKTDKGVLAQTGTVLIIVAVLIVISTPFHSGFSDLLGLLIGAPS